MAKKTKAQIEFEANTSGFNQGIKSMDQSLGTLRKELKLNSTELKGNADDVDLLAERKELLQKESEASANKVELLSKKLNEAERLFGSSSNEVRLLNNQLLDAKNVFQGIQNEIAQTDNKLNNLENGLGETKKEMKNVDGATDDLSDGFTTMKGVVADLVADGIQKLSGSLKDLAVDSDTAHSSFQAQTGASKDEMVEFESAMEEIYSNNFGESLNDIANAMAEVKQQTKQTDPSKLKTMTENALTLRDTFDMDVAESMRAVNSLMNQFGLDSDQAFNLVVQGAQQGLNANGDMLDVINEYSVQFKTAGFSAEDMFNMLMSGAETGTWSIDKLGDAIKEFNIRASDGTIPDAIKENAKALGLSKKEAESLAKQVGDGNVEAYQKFQDKLKNIDDDTTRYQIGVQAYGTMWEDLGEETVLSLMDMNDQFNATHDSMNEVKEIKYDNITSELGEISRGLKEDILIPIVQDLLPILKEGLTWIKNNLEWLLPVVEGIGIAIATYFVVGKIMGFIGAIKTIIGLVKTGTTVFGALNTVMALNPIGLIIGAIAGLIAIFVLLWNKCDWFREFWINLWNKIKEVFGIVVDWLKSAFQSFMDFLGTAGEWINTNVIQPIIGFFKDLWDGVKECWEGIKDGFQTFLDFLGTVAEWINTNVIQPVIGFFKALWDGIKAVWDGICLVVKIAIGLIGSIISTAVQIITLPFMFIWENCKEYVFQAWEWIKSAVSTAINFVSNIITTVFTAVKDFFSTVWEGIKTIFTNVWNAIVGFITPIVNSIKNTITTVFNAIKNTITTVINTIKSIVTTVFNAIKNTITTIFNAIKDVVTTVWNAIKNAITTVINAIKGVITNVFNAIKNTVSNIFNGIKNTVSNVWNGIKNTVSNVVNGMKNSIVNTFNSVKSKVTTIFNNIKSAIQKPIEKARDLVKGAIDKIKGFFNFKFEWPKLKLPKFGITPAGWKIGDLLEGKIPKLGITWNKEGAIFRKPTLFDTRSGLQGVGEAGAEAILPIEKLENWMNNGFNRMINNNYYNNEKIERLVEVAEEILAKPTDVYMDRVKVGQAMAETNDNIGGQRVNFKNRGVIL